MRILQYIVFLVSIIRTKAIVVDWNGDKDKHYKHHNSLEFSPINNSTRELQKALKCTDGQVGGYACNNVNLQARMPLYSLGAFGPEEKMEASDIWGWTDPVTGIEYAIIGLFQGTVFVDLSTPQIPKVIAKLPATVEGAAARDIKTYGQYAYIVSETTGHGMQIFDMSVLREITDAEAPVFVRPTAFYGFTGNFPDGRSSRKKSSIDFASDVEDKDLRNKNDRNLRGYDDYYLYDDNYYRHEDDDDSELFDGMYPSWWIPGGDAHNIAINEQTGYAYLVGSDKCNGGLYILDLTDPLFPEFAGCFSDTGYIHDVQCVVYRGPDKTYKKREICFASNGKNGLSVIDVTNKAGPLLISRIDKAYFKFVSQGWLSEEHRFFIMSDEGRKGGSKTYIIDISDLDKPILNGIYTSELEAQPHNLYVRGIYIYQANYRGGLRILNLLEIYGDNAEAGFFDLYKDNDNYGPEGAFGVYPFFRSGNVIVSSTEDGLFVVNPKWLKPPEPPVEEPCGFFGTLLENLGLSDLLGNLNLNLS